MAMVSLASSSLQATMTANVRTTCIRLRTLMTKECFLISRVWMLTMLKRKILARWKFHHPDWIVVVPSSQETSHCIELSSVVRESWRPEATTLWMPLPPWKVETRALHKSQWNFPAPDNLAQSKAMSLWSREIWCLIRALQSWQDSRGLKPTNHCSITSSSSKIWATKRDLTKRSKWWIIKLKIVGVPFSEKSHFRSAISLHWTLHTQKYKKLR